MAKEKRPKLAVFKLASCDGCQLTLLDCEDELPALARAVTIAYFPEGFREMIKGPYDMALIEGSITTAHDEKRIQRIRRNAKTVIAIGACAASGGIQALRNFADVQDFARMVYPKPEYIHTLSTSTPVSDHIAVDYELRGCPINKVQLLEVISALLNQRKPALPSHSVCVECKRSGYVCVMVAAGIACLGPVTQAGCGALCPTYERGCYGCYGPQEAANTASLSRHMQTVLQMGDTALRRAFRGFNAAAPAFYKESKCHEK